MSKALIRCVIMLFATCAGAHQAAPCGHQLVVDASVPELSANSLESVDALITTEGFMNDGIFRVRARGGESLLLKVSRVLPQNLKNVGRTVEIQRRLSEFGLAPRIHGVFHEAALEHWRSELRRLHPRFRQYIGDFINVGLLMDEIAHGWNPKSTLPPPVNSAWNEAEIAAQFKGLKASVERLRIDNYDWQFLIDTQGKVWLIDFDSAIWAKDRGNRYFLFDVYLEHVLERMRKVVRTSASESQPGKMRSWIKAFAR